MTRRRVNNTQQFVIPHIGVQMPSFDEFSTDIFEECGVDVQIWRSHAISQHDRGDNVDNGDVP